MEREGDDIPIVVGALRKPPKAWKGDWKNWKSEEELRSSKLWHCWEQPEYREESWRSEDSCSHSSERQPTNAGAKNSQGVK